MNTDDDSYKVSAAYGVILADGFFGVAFTLHLLSVPAGGLTLSDFLFAGIFFSVFLSACGVIYDQYWTTKKQVEAGVVKMLRIKELKQGAHLEFDGKRYQVDSIDRANGEILIHRVGQPGSIIVQIEGLG